jgi:hypothetical protein
VALFHWGGKRGPASSQQPPLFRLDFPILQLTLRHCQPQRFIIGQPLLNNFPKLADCPNYAGFWFSVPLQISVRASTVRALVCFETSPAQREAQKSGGCLSAVQHIHHVQRVAPGRSIIVFRGCGHHDIQPICWRLSSVLASP